MKPKSASALALRIGSCLLALFAGACGYQSAQSAALGDRLCVLAAPSKIPDLGAVQAALEGSREELSRHGALAAADEYPCLRVEVLRVDESAAGVAAVDLGGTQQPRARGTAVAIIGRGWVESAPGGPVARDTGDVRRTARLQTSSGVLEGVRHDRGLEAAAYELGRALARSVLGLPLPSDELP